jgi:hypothetical protein
LQYWDIAGYLSGIYGRKGNLFGFIELNLIRDKAVKPFHRPALYEYKVCDSLLKRKQAGAGRFIMNLHTGFLHILFSTRPVW